MPPRRYPNRINNLSSELPSQHYQRISEVLWNQYLERQIDHNRYLELLEQAKDEEINSEHEKYKVLGGISPERRSRIEYNIWEHEQQRQKAREQEAQRKAEAERKKSLSPIEKYKEEIPETITRYRNESNSYRSKANLFQICIIVGSVLVTSASSAVGFGLGDVFRWIAPAISIVVTISAGLTAYFKFRERSFNLQQTADAIEQEYNAVELGIGYYKGKQPPEALQLFAERVEFLKDEQKKRQQQLEQPPDMKHGQNHT